MLVGSFLGERLERCHERWNNLLLTADNTWKNSNVAYQVEGSFFKIPKTFTIYDAVGEQVSGISKEILTFMPRFDNSVT